MQADLAESAGHEILWIAKTGTDGKVTELRKVAEGTIDAVSALFPHMEGGDAVVHNHPSGVIQPSGPDLGIASQLGQWGIGFFIVDNALKNIKIVTEPVAVKELTALDTEALASILEPGGKLSEKPGWEYRQGQVDLLKAICRAFTQKKVLAAEAGTGIGKSYAYLIPGLKWAAQNQERVVISTGTINLQRQVLENDIPRVQELLGTNLKAELVKGRGNYLCPARLQEEIRDGGEGPQDMEILQILADWAENSKTGDKEELPKLPDSGIWSRICSDKEICAGLHCGFREECFLSKARRRAAAANILVVNHHLLFADLSLRLDGMGWEVNAILPPFKRLILDEAHKIEESATSYFSEMLSKFGILRLISRIYKQKKRKTTGLVVSLQGLSSSGVELVKVPKLVGNIEENTRMLSTLSKNYLGLDNSKRLRDPNDPMLKAQVLEPLKNLRMQMAELVRVCRKLYESLSAEEQEYPEAFELRSITRKLEAVVQTAGRYSTLEKNGEFVYWMEKTPSDQEVNLVISPVILGPYLVDALFEPIATVVAVSATLTVGGKFDHFTSRTGLDLLSDQRFEHFVFPSPFDYARRVLLAIPSDLPPPDQQGWMTAAVKIAWAAVKTSGGGALLLFTSNDTLYQARDTMTPLCAEAGIPLYYQGRENRTELLKRFNEERDSILLATYSFWEGIDSPGDTLRLLVIFKLPFTVPTDPIHQARKEYLETQGKDSFRDLSLPEAVIRFKQGFGRLMRRTDDGGCILVLDTRLITKFYGKTFLASLPITRNFSGIWDDTRDEIASHFRSLIQP